MVQTKRKTLHSREVKKAVSHAVCAKMCAASLFAACAKMCAASLFAAGIGLCTAAYYDVTHPSHDAMQCQE